MSESPSGQQTTGARAEFRPETGATREDTTSFRAEARAGSGDDHPFEVVMRMPNLLGWFRRHLPDEFFEHMRNVQRENLLPMRSLIDAAIERTERPRATRTRVDIKID